MAEVTSLPAVLGAYLADLRLSWYAVWKPLRKAKQEGRAVEVRHQIMIFGYDPKTELFEVATEFGEIENAFLNEQNFIREVGKHTRGAPEC